MTDLLMQLLFIDLGDVDPDKIKIHAVARAESHKPKRGGYRLAKS